RADKTTVFADGLMIPTGLEIAPTSGTQIGSTAESAKDAEGRRGEGDKGEEASSSISSAPLPNPSASLFNPSAPLAVNTSAAYIGEGSKLWLMTDTDGDGRADKKEIVLRGFGTGDNHQNINSFRWSPGGELFFSQGLHAFARIETPHGIVPLDEAGFWRFRPREHRLDSFYGGPADPQNPWGFVWTDWGQMLMVAGNNGGIFWPLPEMIRGHRYGKRDQIWVNARGRKTSGPDIVGTAHLPPEWQGRFITGGYINNAVWSMAIDDDGAGFKLTDREPLITSTHTSFRPVDVKIGPDGAIYICDWYNPIIGHYQASFRHPDRDKTHGRIWRVTYKARPLVKPPQIAGAALAELFENLRSNERWVREQTRRELAGRPSSEVIPALRKWWPQGILGSTRDPRVLSGDPAGESSQTREAPNSPAALQGLPASPGSDAFPAASPETARGLARTPQHDAFTERTLLEVIGVFESHETPDKALIGRVMASSDARVAAYGFGVLARWAERMMPVAKVANTIPTILANATMQMEDAHEARLRLAAIIAEANLPSRSAVIAILQTPNPTRDRFVELAARSAISALKQHADELLGEPETVFGPALRERLAELRRPPGTAKPSATAATGKITPAVPATGKLRATPELLAELVREVKEKGDAKRGAEVYRRAELACTTCHSIADQGGKIGPPLDNIGSGQPLDFIIGATLEPQREIKESYEAMQLTAKDGRTAIGYIAARDPTGTTIREPATGAETKFAASDIAEQKQLGSFMPAGLVDNLPRADLRDLFRYLSELGKPQP
ncbi:MAG: Membrane-bound dehydrogenase domain protein, partial [Chthoniobacter sp.]|nr:Membrane-bound dehydrogenase domain protein [Chthoniobacter sp.]